MSVYPPAGRLAIGLVLPTKGEGACRESLDAAAEIATDLGWESVWVTDHLFVPNGPEAEEYGWILEATAALTYVAARHSRLRVGTSVIVPAMRDAPLLAKQLATIDCLSGGRLVVGVGASDAGDLTEYENLGKGGRFLQRGAYLDEAIALWRHLWCGLTTPFEGKFHRLDDFTFLPLPVQRPIPVLSGGRSERALERAARLADGYHAAQTGPVQLRQRLPKLAAQCERFGRPLPPVSVRARVCFDVSPGGTFAICGPPEKMVGDLVAMAGEGVSELMVVLDGVRPDDVARLAVRFQDEVVGPASQSISARGGG